jgi:CHAD domain-containing protein
MSLRLSVIARRAGVRATADPQPPGRAVRPCAPDDPLLTLVYHDLDRQFDALQRSLALLRDDRIDAVHRARNATRRLRGTLKEFRDLLPASRMRRLRSELSWLADLLGQVRDLDVHRARLVDGLRHRPASVHLESYLRHVEQQHSDSVRALEDALADERYARLLANFGAFLDREPSRAALARAPAARDAAAEYAVRALRKLRRAGRRIDRHSPPEELHRLRIRCKRLRYQLESFEPAYEDRPRKITRKLKRLQDSLGAHHDATVAAQRLRAYAASEGAGLSATSRRAVRELIDLQDADAKASLRAFRRDWRRFEKRMRPRKLTRTLH